MSWTEERVEKLKAMWAEGMSASQIAKELGGVTRNAVIGKIHRLGLSNRAAASASPAEAAPAAQAASASEAETSAQEPAAAKAAEAPAAEKPAPDSEEAARAATAALVSDNAPPAPPRKPVVTPGQPLPPQPSANEIPAEALARSREAEKRARKISLMELTERTCKWPIGDPATEDFWFCGLPTQPGKPYCEAHVEVAYQPMSSRRDRRR